MIILLNEKNARNYDILIIHKRVKTYNFRDIDFVLKDNERKFCFYINDRIDKNN